VQKKKEQETQEQQTSSAEGNQPAFSELMNGKNSQNEMKDQQSTNGEQQYPASHSAFVADNTASLCQIQSENQEMASFLLLLHNHNGAINNSHNNYNFLDIVKSTQPSDSLEHPAAVSSQHDDLPNDCTQSGNSQMPHREPNGTIEAGS